MATSILVDPLQHAKTYNTNIDGYYTFESHSSNQFSTNWSLKVFQKTAKASDLTSQPRVDCLHFFNFRFTCHVINYFANFTSAVPLHVEAVWDCFWAPGGQLTLGWECASLRHRMVLLWVRPDPSLQVKLLAHIK